MISVVVPIRSFAGGKSRLAPAVDPGARRSLVERMAARALTAAHSYPVTVVTADDEVSAWAAARGAAVFPDPGLGLNPALEAARRHLAAPVLVLFADLPEVTAADVDDLAGSAPAIAPDLAGTGTNALYLPASSPVRYRFGPGSFALHVAQAPGMRVVRRRGLAADVDSPDDLRMHQASGTRQ